MGGETISHHAEQPKNEALEKHEQAIHSLQASPELQHLPNSLSTFFNKQLRWLENMAESEQATLELEHMTQALWKLSALTESLSEPSWLEPFWKLIAQLGENGKKAIINTLATEPIDALKQEVQDNGIPTTELALKVLWKRFWIDTALLNIENNKASENKNIDTANIESLTDIYRDIADTSNTTPAFQLLKQVAAWWQESQAAYHKLKALLLSDPKQLDALISTVQQFDKEHSTRHYETLKRTLIAADPAFLGMLNELSEPHSHIEHKEALPHAYISSLTGKNPSMHGQQITSTNTHGDTISVDMSSEPPLRTLALEGSEYALETKSDIGALHKPDLKYWEKISELNTQLTTLNLLQSDFVQGHIEDLAEHGSWFLEIQHQFKSVYGINLDFVDNLQELRSPPLLEAKQSKIEQQVNTLKDDYLTALDEAIQAHREEVFDQDEKTREVLKTVSSIGFDLIPKRFTDQLIAEVKSGAILLHDLNINPATADLKNGTFWESQFEQGWTQWKKNLIGFYNKIISGKPEWPIDAASHLGAFGKVENKTALRHQLVSNDILSESGVFNIEKARENLARKPSTQPA
jgi:hypothetical protein